MLPSELIVVRYRENKAVPLELGAVPDNLELIAQLIEVFEKAVGGTRGALQETLSLFEADETNYKQKRGLAHLLSSFYSNFEAVSPLEPEALRYKVFVEAAKSPPNALSRRQVLETVAGQLSEGSHSVAPEEVQAGLYADLEHRAILTNFQPPEPLELLERFNLSQAQGTLYRAFSLGLEIGRSSAATYQAIFKALKKQGLMYLVQGDSEKGFIVTVDGPSSLFKPSTRYGLAMAKLLPALLLVSKWTLEASLRPKRDYGEQLELAKFSLDAGCGLVSHYKKGELFDSVLEEQFADKFEKGGGEWTLEREVDLLPLPGGGLMIPDFRLVHPDGRSYLLEIVGYWRPDYLRKKFSQIRNSGRDDLVVAVSERLNLEGAGVKLEGVGAKVVWFKGSLLPKQVLELLN